MKHRTIISRRAARGFTLVELLAAVSIAGVLSSIARRASRVWQRARRADATLRWRNCRSCRNAGTPTAAATATWPSCACPSAAAPATTGFEVGG